MPTQNLLYRRYIPVNDKISVVVPTVGEILADEDTYYGNVSVFTAMPIDMMVQLDDAGIDYSKISEWELFILLFRGLCSAESNRSTSLILGDLDLTKFQIAKSEQNGDIVFVDPENDIVIDRAIHAKIGSALRKIHHMEKNRRKPGNEEARQYLLERARKKLNRKKNRMEDSQLESLIIALVNTEQYKYDFEGTLELSIYQFNESVRQIIKKIDYDNRMHGVYAGTISVKDLSQDDLNWLSHK